MDRLQHASRVRPALAGTLALALALAGMAGAATAASLQVAPTSLRLEAEETADGLWLSNTGDTPLHAQVRIFRWTQVDGEEVLAPTQDIALSPPLLVLAAHSQQLVRVVRTSPPPTGDETSYRVLVDELPVEGEDGAPKSGLQFVLRYSVPVFVQPQGAPVKGPALAPMLVRGADGKAEVAIDNSGAQHAQVVDLALVAASGERYAIADGLAGYVLAGEERRWVLPPGLAASGARVTAKINGETLETALALADRRP